MTRAGYALKWGSLQETNVTGEVELFSDCHHRSQEAYDVSTAAEKKYETRAKQPDTPDLFLRCAEQHVGI